MLVPAVVCFVGLIAVLWAIWNEPPPPEPALVADLAGLPTPADVARAEFPLAVPGYDPAAVEVRLDAIARAWADLLAVTPPEVLERARQRIALRVRGPAAADEAVAPPAGLEGPARRPLYDREEDDRGPRAGEVAGEAEARDALRADAALASLPGNDAADPPDDDGGSRGSPPHGDGGSRGSPVPRA